jgi:hypothetical protein
MINNRNCVVPTHAIKVVHFLLALCGLLTQPRCGWAIDARLPRVEATLGSGAQPLRGKYRAVKSKIRKACE